MARPSSPSIPSADGDRWQLLNLYVDGEATAAERQACEALLEQEPIWRQHLQQLRRLRAALQSLPGEPSPHSATDLAAGVFAARQRHPRPSRWLLAAGVALAAAIGGGSWLLGDRSLQMARQIATEPGWVATSAPQHDPLYLALDEPVMAVPGSVQEVVYDVSP